MKQEQDNSTVPVPGFQGQDTTQKTRTQSRITLVLWFSAFSPSYRDLLKDISPKICSSVISLSNYKAEQRTHIRHGLFLYSIHHLNSIRTPSPTCVSLVNGLSNQKVTQARNLQLVFNFFSLTLYLMSHPHSPTRPQSVLVNSSFSEPLFGSSTPL